MNRSSAIEVKHYALEAVECLSRAFAAARAGYSEDEIATLHRVVGRLIGSVQMEVLEPIYTRFDDLDDLLNCKPRAGHE